MSPAADQAGDTPFEQMLYAERRADLRPWGVLVGDPLPDGFTSSGTPRLEPAIFTRVDGVEIVRGMTLTLDPDQAKQLKTYWLRPFSEHRVEVPPELAGLSGPSAVTSWRGLGSTTATLFEPEAEGAEPVLVIRRMHSVDALLADVADQCGLLGVELGVPVSDFSLRSASNTLHPASTNLYDLSPVVSLYGDPVEAVQWESVGPQQSQTESIERVLTGLLGTPQDEGWPCKQGSGWFTLEERGERTVLRLAQPGYDGP